MTDKVKRYVERVYIKDPCGQDIRISQTGEYSLSDLILKEHPDIREKILTALAQGYCCEETKHEEMNATLCIKQADAILDLLGIKKEV